MLKMLMKIAASPLGVVGLTVAVQYAFVCFLYLFSDTLAICVFALIFLVDVFAFAHIYILSKVFIDRTIIKINQRNVKV